MEVEPNRGELEDMIEQQLDLTDDTFALVKCLIDKLNDIDFELNVMKVKLNNTKVELNDMKVKMNEMDVLLRDTVNDLKNEKSQTKILRTFQDWLGTFFNKLTFKLGKDNDHCYENVDVSQYECVVSLSKILSEINMDFEDFILLMEMKETSNNAFHRGWQKIEEAKEQLKQHFPDDLEKFRTPLQNLFSTNTWIAWRKAIFTKEIKLATETLV